MRTLALAAWLLLIAPTAALAQYDPVTNTFKQLNTLPAANLNTALKAAQDRGAAAALAAVRLGPLSIGDAAATNYGLFGIPQLRVATRNAVNAIVGITDNNAPAGTESYPVGVTGYGNLTSAGSTVFGLFGRADLRSPGTATNELNAFNYCGPPSAILPPSTGFGTAECNAIPLQVIPYGNFNNSVGVLFGPGVNDAFTAPILFRTMLYSRPGTFSDSGIFLDGGATDTAPALRVTRGGGGQHVVLKSVGTAAPGAAVISYQDATGTQAFAVLQSGEAVMSRAALAPTTYVNLPTPTIGKVAYCSDCFAAPSTTLRGTLVFGNGAAWQAVQSAAATH